MQMIGYAAAPPQDIATKMPPISEGTGRLDRKVSLSFKKGPDRM